MSQMAEIGGGGMRETLYDHCGRTGRTELLCQRHPMLSRTLTAATVTPGSHRKAWRQCPEGHLWKAMIYSRAGPQKCGCPV